MKSKGLSVDRERSLDTFFLALRVVRRVARLVIAVVDLAFRMDRAARGRPDPRQDKPVPGGQANVAGTAPRAKVLPFVAPRGV